MVTFARSRRCVTLTVVAALCGAIAGGVLEARPGRDLALAARGERLTAFDGRLGATQIHGYSRNLVYQTLLD